jgi:hypothetical protein
MTELRDSKPEPVAHACNSRYLGGRDQEDHGLKPAWANSSWKSISKMPNPKKEWWSGSSGRVPASKLETLNSNHNTIKR